MGDDVEEQAKAARVRQVQAVSGELVEVPVDDEGDVVVFWLDATSAVPGGAIRNATGQVLATAVKLPTGYVTVPVGVDRTPLDVPIAAKDETA